MKSKLLLIFVLLVSLTSLAYALQIGQVSIHKAEISAFRDCVIPEDGMIITEDTLFCEGTYYLPNGINMGSDDITLDCNNAVLDGAGWHGFGINISFKSSVIIKNCNILGYEDEAIQIIDSNEIGVYDNNLECTDTDRCILITRSIGSILLGNEIISDEEVLDIWGNEQEHYNHTIDTTNTINGRPIYYYYNVDNMAVENVDAGLIECHYCNWFGVINVNLIDGNGIYLENTNGFSINDNLFANNKDAIYIRESNNGEIRSNEFINNRPRAIYLEYSNENMISYNNIAFNAQGIFVRNSNNNIITQNIITASQEYAIQVWYSSNNMFTFNDIVNNLLDAHNDGAIYLRYNSSSNSFNFNDIYGNSGFGLYDIYNNQGDDVNAENNYWGTNDSNEIAQRIYDYYDDPILGVVDFDPWSGGIAEADLAVVDIIFEPENPIVGDQVNVTAILTNYGRVESLYSVSVGVETPWGGFGGGGVPDPNNPLEPGEIEESTFDFDASGEGTYIVTVTIHAVEEDFNPENNQRVENITVY